MLTALALACALAPAECHATYAAPVFAAIDAATDHEGLRAHLVEYGYRESHWMPHPRAESWDARAGVAHGFLQLWGPAGSLPLVDQCRAWLLNVQASSLASVDSSPTRAARRAAEAARLLGE